MSFFSNKEYKKFLSVTKYKEFLSKKKFKKIFEIFYKPEYEVLLQQDRFWFKSVTWGIIGTSLFGVTLLTFAKTDEIVWVPGKIVPIGDVKEIKEQVKSVSYSVLYMKAIKALQEAMAKIETLETKVKALEDA